LFSEPTFEISEKFRLNSLKKNCFDDYALLQSAEINSSTSTNECLCASCNFCVGLGERKWSLDLCVFRCASAYEARGETSRRGWVVGVVFGSGVDSTSLDAASPSTMVQLSLPLSSHSDPSGGILKSYTKPISRFEEEAPPRISSDDTAINVHELNRWSRERNTSQWGFAKFIFKKLKNDDVFSDYITPIRRRNEFEVKWFTRANWYTANNLRCFCEYQSPVKKILFTRQTTDLAESSSLFGSSLTL